MLPEGHAERVATRLVLAISAVEREDDSAATAILEAYMDDEEDRTTKVSAAPIMTQLHSCACTGCAVVVRYWAQPDALQTEEDCARCMAVPDAIERCSVESECSSSMGFQLRIYGTSMACTVTACEQE